MLKQLTTKELQRRLNVLRNDITADTDDKILARMYAKEAIENELEARWQQDEPSGIVW